MRSRPPGGRATPLQAATLEQLAQAGAVAALVRSVADVKAILGGDVHVDGGRRDAGTDRLF